jgi:hypothetical protein
MANQFLGFLGKAFATSKAFHISLSLLFGIFLVGLPLYDSIRIGNAEPLIKGVGGVTMGVDEKLGVLTDEAITKGFGVMLLVQLLGCLWFYYVFVRLFYWFWDKMSIHGQIIVVFVSLLTIAALQVAYYAATKGGLYTPLSGLWHFATNADVLISPTRAEIDTYVMNMSEANLTI